MRVSLLEISASLSVTRPSLEQVPRVLNKRHGAADGVYVGRPSKWGNPFTIGQDGRREDVIRKYAEWLSTQPELLAAAKVELRGRNLICWCAPLPCHADVLLEVANS